MKSLWSDLLLVVAGWIAFAIQFSPACSYAADAPVKIIFDSDVDHDCDDIAALFMLHGAVERGEAELLATIGCTSTGEIAPCLDAINTWFGRPAIPVATLKDKGFLDHKGFAAEITKRYPCKHTSGNDYPDAVSTYRRILVNESDGSVVILAVGPLRNIANLLQSKPDDVSPLDGVALVAKKVKRLDIMGGMYPPQGNLKEGEWNFKQDPESAALVCSTWPTPILFNGEGGSTNSGRRVTFEMPEHNPLTMAFRHSADVGFASDRLSWDPISTLVAVRGPIPWFEVVKGGTNVVDPKTGINTWKADADRGHAYLVMKAPKSQIETALEDLQTAGRGRPTKLTFNTSYYADAGMCRITARGEAEPSRAAVNAFDPDDRSAWLDNAASSWIQCQYVDGRKYRATSYTVICPDRDRLPATLKLSGSNDGIRWTELDVQKAPGFSERISRQVFGLANMAKWNRYRLDMTAINEQEGVRIATIELNEEIHCRPEVAVDALTLDMTELSLSANSRAPLNATLAPLNSFDREVAWASSDLTVAEVRQIGEQVVMVVGKKPGKCTLTATAGEVKQSCRVTVTPTTLPDGWKYDELNAPAIPGSIEVSEGRFTLTGCGHAMTSWWERVRDQGVFVSQPAIGNVELTVRLASLSSNVGGPNAYHTDSRPPTASGLMIRESLDEKACRYFLIQLEASGNLVCRWRDKSGDQDDNQSKPLGKIAVPSHLRLVRSGKVIEVFASTDGKDWGQPLMSHPAEFAAGSRIGLFVCSGNTFASAKAVYDSVQASLDTANINSRIELPVIERVDAQPLLLQTRRLVEALDTLGSPLPVEAKSSLAELKQEPDDAKVTASIQRILDPLCLASVEIQADGTVNVTAGQAVEVEENGWRTMLVKVLNRAGVQSRLGVDSPHARPIPHGPSDDVPNRWLSLNAFDGRPLDASLSGLGLEYRLVQMSSIRSGERQARLEFNAGVAGAKGSQLIRQWKFDKDADGWGQSNDLEIEVRDKSLQLKSTGKDPYFSAPVNARGGKMILRFWGKTDSSEIGQMFWWTDQLPQPDGQRQKNFPLKAGREQEYAIEFPVEGDLRGVRLDPLQSTGTFRIDWISLEYAAGENGQWSGADITINTLPSTPVTFQVTDADGSPCMGCFEIRDAQGRVYPAQSKRLAPDFFFQTQIYRESSESIRLPQGTFTLKCSHGPESIPETKTITVGQEPVTVDYRVQRWIDTAKRSYWSGDHHIHAAGCLHYENPTQGVHPPDMLRHIMGEDVKVGCCLTWGPCFDYQKRFFSGQPDNVSRYPYLLRYDIEVSGFGSHQSGHLNLLKLSEQIPLGGDSKDHWPTLGLNTLRWAKKQGAVTGTAHSGAGLERSVGRVPGEDGPHKLPGFDIPAFDGIGANEFIMQVTHTVEGPTGEKVPALDFIATMNTPREQEWNIWYHVLNCGIPVVASGETDFPCMTGERLGIGRVYVKLPGQLDYDEWAEALRRGESYVSNGTSHLMNFQRQSDGSLTVDAAAWLPDAPEIEVELIANGRPIAVQKVRADGELRTLTFPDPKLPHSAWLAVRTFPSAHTNPLWVTLDDQPVRVKESISWCFASLEQCWKEKQRTYAVEEMKQAKADYEHARLTYRRLLDEASR